MDSKVWTWRWLQSSPIRLLDLVECQKLRQIQPTCGSYQLQPQATQPRQCWVSIQRELQRWQLQGEILSHLERTEGSFDVAVLQHVLCSVEAPEELLLQARQRLRPGRRSWK
eukprot:s265_g9.t1